MAEAVALTAKDIRVGDVIRTLTSEGSPYVRIVRMKVTKVEPQDDGGIIYLEVEPEDG